MAIMGFNPAAEMTQVRTQRTLAMQAAAPAPAAAAAPGPVEAGVKAAALPGGAADAAIGAAAVQEPPATSKIVLQSVLKGAMTGASVTMGLKSFGPTLAKLPFLGGLIGTLPKGVPPVGTGLLGILGKLPILSSLLPKIANATGFQGFLIAGLVGATIGAVAGAFSGIRKSKAAAAEYAEAMAAQQAQQPVGDPVNAPEPAPAPAPAGARPRGRRAKSWIISRTGATSKPGGSFGQYTTKPGDSIAMIAKRFHTTEAEIMKLNPSFTVQDGGRVAPGEKLKLRRKVVPDAKAWVA